jgi:outer membrane protein assembly factor BamB
MRRVRQPGSALFPWCAAVIASLLSASSFAQARPGSLVEESLITGYGPPSLQAPAPKPFFLGWSTQLTPSVASLSEVLKLPREPGGVVADPISGWVYAGTRDGRLVAVNGGDVVWSVDVGGQLLAPAMVHKNIVIAGTAEGVVYVLNKVTGERKARAILGEELITQPVVLDDGAGHVRAFIGSSAESVFAVNIEDGLKLWRVHRDAPSGFTVYGFARPIVALGSVFAGFADGVVAAIDPVTGAAKWEKHISPPGEMLDVDGLAFNGVDVFAASYSGGVFSLDPATGDVRWEKKLSQVSRVVTDGFSVYAGSPGAWTGMRADDGFVNWRFAFGNGRTQTSAVLAAEKVLAFAEEDGPIYFVDRRTGQGLGVLGVGDGFSSPPTMVGRVMFALSNFGRVYSAVIAP